MVTASATSGHLGGTNGNDTLTGIAQRGTGQIHIYSKAGDDLVHLDFAGIDKYSMGHHVRGDGSGGIDDTSTNRGNDTFNFRNLHNVDDVVVGRIEDFDSSRDSLSIEGNSISLTQLEQGSGTTSGYSWRIVEYDADSRDEVTAKQQWILIDTGQGYAFYALEGARVSDMQGASNSGQQEAHFVGASGGHRVTASELQALPTVGYIDPVNYVPSGYTAQGGVTINDDDNVFGDTQGLISGTSSGDLIAAGLNDDRVHAGSGNDYVWGGSGDDSISGQNGNDVLRGGTGDDRLYGGSGNDKLVGGHGDDYLRDDGGRDDFYGGSGTDTVSYYGWYDGAAANTKTLEVDLQSGANNSSDTYASIENILGSKTQKDELKGTDGANVMNGSGGDDKLWGRSGNDQLKGGTGTDRLYGGNGNDNLYGGDGDDYLRDDSGRDNFYGGAGSDTVSYYGWYDSAADNTKTLKVDLKSGTNNSVDTYSSIENILGSKTQKDELKGTDGTNILNGSGGNDKLWGRAGNDVLKGGSDNDYLNGGDGNDELFGGSGADHFRFYRGQGNDNINDFENNIDTISLANFEYSSVSQALADADQVGSDVVFDFGSNGSLTIEDATIGQLANDLIII